MIIIEGLLEEKIRFKDFIEVDDDLRLARRHIKGLEEGK